MTEKLDTALGKGLRVLEALSQAQSPVRLSTLAADLALQKSAVHRVLQTLLEAGFVHQDQESGLYGATLKLWQLGVGVMNALPVKQAATNVLQALHRQTGETVSLSILDGDHVLYLEKIIAPRPMGFTTKVGSRVPAPYTVAGRAMLAYEDDPRPILKRYLGGRKAEADAMDKALADIRQARDEGYLVGEGRVERGIVGMAAAVPGADGRGYAGLTVSAPRHRLTAARQRDFIDALLTATAQLSEALGQH